MTGRARLRAVDADLMGLRCQACAQPFDWGATVAQCSACGSVHHVRCWEATARCASYECSSGRMQREAPAESAAPLRIGTDDLHQATPQPAARPSVAYGRRRNAFDGDGSEPAGAARSGLAMASFITALVGILVIGLVTGLAAVVLAIIAMLRDRGRRRGLGFAVAGLLIGAFDMLLWVGVIAYYADALSPTSNHAVLPEDLDIRSEEIDAAGPVVARALRANVLLTVEGLLSQSLGSGVVLRMDAGSSIILTNRHVVDSDYNGEDDNDDPPSAPVLVRFVDGVESLGRTIWVAPSGVDLAIVRAAGTSAGARVVSGERGAMPPVGERIFAIGNPHGLGWTFTEGTLSQHRVWRMHGRAVDVVQTTAAVNPGNSGGGLYTKTGHLIGINSVATDKRVAEGLGFAISLESFWAMAPDWLTPGPVHNGEDEEP